MRDYFADPENTFFFDKNKIQWAKLWVLIQKTMLIMCDSDEYIIT